MDNFISKLENSNSKITFGLQPHHIKRIEEKREHLNNIKLETFTEEELKGVDVIYSHYFWEDLGKEFSWYPLTLSLYYFEYLFKNKLSTPKQ